MGYKQFFKSWLLVCVGVLIAANTSSGIHYNSYETLLLTVLLLSLCNLFLKPLLMLFSLPFIILTMGLGIWLINAVLFLLVSEVVPGFQVDTFGNALWGALVVSITSAVANALFGTSGRSRVNVQFNRTGHPTDSVSGNDRDRGPSPRPRKPLKDDDDVIDI